MEGFWKWRPVISFVGGILGIAYEAVLHQGPARSEFLLLYGGMIGLTGFLYKDQKRTEE